jgi:hypothetical protein
MSLMQNAKRKARKMQNSKGKAQNTGIRGEGFGTKNILFLNKDSKA